jgi:eukaryotic-like serine/threonine-protein kinase
MAHEALEAGRLFARYEIEGFVGRGGAGEVYSAFDSVLKRRVALKVLHPREDRNNAVIVLREARAAAGLNHPNAVSIFDVGEVEGTPFIAMELVVGSTLRAKAQDPQVSIGTRLRWLVDIASVLAHAHQSGLIHRDVKPENIMVSQNGTIKVLDFGIARRAREEGVPSSRRRRLTPPDGNKGGTAEGRVEGTPRYMAPEQLYGDPVDGRTDQYAWGLVAYEMLSGHLPGSEAVDGSFPHFAVPPPLLNQVAPKVPFEVAATIMQALEVRPAFRHPSMLDVARASCLSPSGLPRVTS